MPPPDPLDELRAELRRLWAGAPGGTWTAPGSQAFPGGVVAILPDGRRTNLGAFFYGEAAAQLVAAARNALPVLFAALDDARAARSVRILGDVGPGDAVSWRGVTPESVTVGAPA